MLIDEYQWKKLLEHKYKIWTKLYKYISNFNFALKDKYKTLINTYSSLIFLQHHKEFFLNGDFNITNIICAIFLRIKELISKDEMQYYHKIILSGDKSLIINEAINNGCIKYIDEKIMCLQRNLDQIIYY
jgi:hypothetical protein